MHVFIEKCMYTERINMSLKDLEIKYSYRSKGPDNIVDSFLNPALSEAVLYKRGAGFFSSSVYELIGPGIQRLIKNGGHIRLICSPELNQEDIDAIKLGYKLKNQAITEAFENDLDELENTQTDNLKLLVSMIEDGVMDVVVVGVRKESDNAIYHDKIGIISDSEGNKVLFVGSANESKHAYLYNYEKIRISYSWRNGDDERIKDDESEFDEIWDDNNPYIKRIKCEEIVVRKIKGILKNRKENEKTRFENRAGIKIRDYQDEAVGNWFKNNKHGFFVMATGTGKTWTALRAAYLINEEENILLVICAPYKHLVRQWYEDVQKVFPSCCTIMISSENSGWDKQLTDAILDSKYNGAGTVIAISTIVSFNLERFERVAQKTDMKRMLIVDEAHRFKNLSPEIKDKYSYMLGLSATPSSRVDDPHAIELVNYFGGQVFNLPIEFAIEKKYLVKYCYHPIYIYATEEEEASFDSYTHKMAGCFKGDVCIDVEKLSKYKRARLRIISMASEKISRFDWILSQVEEKDHFIVYCGDGRLFEGKVDEGKRHIQYIKEQLDQKGFKVSQFTAEEDMKDRMQRVDAFNRGMIDSMVAIRCLDEGINIPSIKGALLLSSNDDLREFVQRRGRILRTYTDEYTGEEKKVANIYDVVVLPNTNNTNFAKIELRRFYEYARIAINHEKLSVELEDLLIQYGLNMEDICTIDESEDELDE